MVKDLYKSIFEQSVVPGLVFNKDGNILMTNDALQQLYGVKISQFGDQFAIEDLFHRRQRKRIVEHYRTISSNQIKSSQFIFRCHNGEERIIELKIRQIDGSNLLYAMLIDLTEYKAYENRAQQLIDRTSVINEIVASVNSNLNKNQLIRIFFNQISKIFGYDLAGIVLCDIEDKELEIHFSKEASELESRRGVGLFYQLFIEALSSCHQIEHDQDVISKVANVLELPVKENYKSQILFQLKTDEQLIGAVILFSLTENALTQYHIDIFHEVSDQIAIAIMKARLLHRYQQSLTNLSFLARINESLSSSLELDIVLKQVVESSQQMMHAKICTIHFLNTEDKLTENLSGSFVDKFVDLFKPQIQQVIVNQKQLIVENADYNNIQFFKNQDDIKKLGLKSIIILPVIANKKTIALLSVFLDKVHYFSEHEIELLSTLADQAAIAIRNAELFKKVERTKNFLESIIHSSTYVIVSTDIKGNTTFFNNSACQLTGYFPGEVVNQPFFERFIKNGHTIYAGLIKELLTKRIVQTFKCEILAKNNKTIPIFWSFSPLIDQHDEIIGTLGIGRDISKRKQIPKNFSLSTNKRK
jgi:PAS domain S-box-containing protein